MSIVRQISAKEENFDVLLVLVPRWNVRLVELHQKTVLERVFDLEIENVLISSCNFKVMWPFDLVHSCFSSFNSLH